MQDYLYSVIGLIAIAIQLVINFKVMFRPDRNKIQKAAAKYRMLMIAILAYYITDALWGILAGLNWISALFLDTTLYYVAMSFAIVCFYKYIVEYLEMRDWRGKFFNCLGIGFFALENLFLIINFFYPCFFWFDANDAYIAGLVRYIALWTQVAMFAVSSVVTFAEVIKSKGVGRKRHLAISFFSLTMLIAILFQEHYPLLPFYAVGCLLGSCILHVYVVGDELEEYRGMLISEKDKLEDFSTQLSNYKRAVLSDALISLEANLTSDQLYYGIWKDDTGNEVPLQKIIGMSTPCSYEKYIGIWYKRFVLNDDSDSFSGSTDREYLLKTFNEGITEVTFDYKAKTISGRSTWLRRNIAMIRNQVGDVIAFTSVKDISTLVEQRKREEAYMRALATEYDSIAVIGLEADKHEDRVLNHSRLTDDMAALLDEETINEENYSRKLDLMLRFVHPEDRKQFYENTRREKVLQSVAKNLNHIVDFRIAKKDGSQLYFQLCFVALRDDEGNPSELIACMRNIDTEIRKELGVRQELENAKIAAEAANQAKSSFLFNMSHDIRTPMNAIIGFTEMAEKHIDDQQRVLESLEKVKMSSEHLLTLINDVLDMSRVESGTVKIEEKPICIDTNKDNLFSLLNGSAEAKNIRFTSEIDSSVEHHWFYADRLHMMRVLTNIVSNSVKYTNPGGRIDLLAEELPCDEVGYARYRYTVSDTGIGMSEDYIAHVFEPFSRAESATKSGVTGTGLGMAITKSLVELMGGTISIESELGVGTTVRVEFVNRIAEPVKASNSVLENSPIDLNGKKILLVEDNELNRQIAIDMLEDEGVIIDVAEDGDVAVEKMRTAEPGKYDLILMDIQMPRMNGYEATKAIRKLPDPCDSGIPIIAMTANAFDEDKRNATAAGMNAHIAKPIEVKRLLTTLAEVLNGKHLTTVLFVRHAQSVHPYSEDRTRPLTTEGLKDREIVLDTLKDRHVDVFLSSPYTRSVQTIQPTADYFGMQIKTDERFRERKSGIGAGEFTEKRWDDFTWAEEEGENLKSVQDRNMEALTEVLSEYEGKTVVIGTHGTALSTIINFYHGEFGYSDFMRTVSWTPYILEMTFDGDMLVDMIELDHIEKSWQKVDFSAITACGESCVKCEKKISGVCPGCIEADGVVPEWSESGRCKIHACAHEHGVQICGLCEKFPCENVSKLICWNPNALSHLAYLRGEYEK